MSLVLFYMWEDARAWSHWNRCSWDVYLTIWGFIYPNTECLILFFILNSSQGALLDGGLRLNPCRTRWFATLFFFFLSFSASHLILWFPAVRKGESRGGSWLSVWEASEFQAMEYDDKSPELERIKPGDQSCPPNIASSFQFNCGSHPDLPGCLKDNLVIFKAKFR